MMTEPTCPEGAVLVASSRDFAATLATLTGTLAARGITVFAVIDHAAGAAAAGLELRPTTVVVFGDARAGTLLMQAAQGAGLDLPLKVLVFEDEHEAVWLSYDAPAWIARRHGVDPESLPVVERMGAALAAVVEAAAQG
jgi:uncharacterized protein (DUF302 family)